MYCGGGGRFVVLCAVLWTSAYGAMRNGYCSTARGAGRSTCSDRDRCVCIYMYVYIYIHSAVACVLQQCCSASDFRAFVFDFGESRSDFGHLSLISGGPGLCVRSQPEPLPLHPRRDPPAPALARARVTISSCVALFQVVQVVVAARARVTASGPGIRSAHRAARVTDHRGW